MSFITIYEIKDKIGDIAAQNQRQYIVTHSQSL